MGVGPVGAALGCGTTLGRTPVTPLVGSVGSVARTTADAAGPLPVVLEAVLTDDEAVGASSPPAETRVPTADDAAGAVMVPAEAGSDGAGAFEVESMASVPRVGVEWVRAHRP